VCCVGGAVWVLCGCRASVCVCVCVGGCVGEWVSWCASVSFHSSINLCVRDDDTSHFRLNSALELNKKYRREYVSHPPLSQRLHSVSPHTLLPYMLIKYKVCPVSKRLTVTTSLGLVSTPVA
jgi:hypothetical protein